MINSEVFELAEDGVTDPQKVLDAFTGYVNSGDKYELGLERRRYDEAEMYLYGDYKRNDDLSLDNPCPNEND